MNQKVQEMTIDQLKGLIRETVEEKLEEMLGDPDWGLGLCPKSRVISPQSGRMTVAQQFTAGE